METQLLVTALAYIFICNVLCCHTCVIVFLKLCSASTINYQAAECGLFSGSPFRVLHCFGEAVGREKNPISAAPSLTRIILNEHVKRSRPLQF